MGHYRQCATAILISALALLTAGCASQPAPIADVAAAPTEAAAPINPGNFKPVVSQAQARRMLVANRERIWKDSRSVRNAKIGDPYECLSNDGTTCFCIEANARNSLGGYTGASLSQAKFDSPTSVRMIDAMYAPEKCGRMVPFPEMNGAQ